MIKEINEKGFFIKYIGEVDELKDLLGEIFKIQYGRIVFEMLRHEINNLEKINEKHLYFSSMSERIYYNNKRIIYGPNVSSEYIFHNIIKTNSIRADRIFLSLDSKL